MPRSIAIMDDSSYTMDSPNIDMEGHSFYAELTDPSTSWTELTDPSTSWTELVK